MLMIMKKEQLELKELIKAAIIEAFAELYGVATTDAVIPEAPGAGDGEAGDSSGNNTGNNGGSNHGNNNNNGGSDETSGGGSSNNGRPIPDAGVGAFGLR